MATRNICGVKIVRIGSFDGTFSGVKLLNLGLPVRFYFYKGRLGCIV